MAQSLLKKDQRCKHSFQSIYFSPYVPDIFMIRGTRVGVDMLGIRVFVPRSI